jgi:hypothetical protein
MQTHDVYWSRDTSLNRNILVWHMWPPTVLSIVFWSNFNRKLSELLWCWIWGKWKTNFVQGRLNFTCWPKMAQRTLVQVHIRLVEPILHAETIIQLKSTSMTTVFQPNNWRLPLQLKIALYRGQVSDHTWPMFNRLPKLPAFGEIPIERIKHTWRRF